MGRSKGIIVALLAAVALAVPQAVHADEHGLIVEAGVDKKLNKKLSLGLDAELRTRNDFRTVDRVSGGVGVRYKFTKWLKAEAGYEFLMYNNAEHLSCNEDGSYKHWRPSFYAPRHRFSFSLTADTDMDRVNVSIRERWQYTYRPEAQTTRYDFDDEAMEDCTVSGKGKNVLRSRIKFEYNIRHCKFTPSASMELYTTKSLEKTKLNVGCSYSLKKRHSFDLGYQFQLYNHSVAPEKVNTQHVTLGYNFKF